MTALTTADLGPDVDPAGPEARGRIVEAIREMDVVDIGRRINLYPTIAGALCALLRGTPVLVGDIDVDVIPFYTAAAVLALTERLFPPAINITAIIAATASSRGTDALSAWQCHAWLLSAAIRLVDKEAGSVESRDAAAPSSRNIGAAIDRAARYDMVVCMEADGAGRLVDAICTGIYEGCRPYFAKLVGMLTMPKPTSWHFTRWDFPHHTAAIYAGQVVSAYARLANVDEGAFRPPYAPRLRPDAGPRGYDCVICHEPGTALRLAEPCGHLAVCGACADAAAPGAPCPVCRTAASYRVIYESAARSASPDAAAAETMNAVESMNAAETMSATAAPPPKKKKCAKSMAATSDRASTDAGPA